MRMTRTMIGTRKAKQQKIDDEKEAAKLDAFIQTFIGWTPEEVDQYTIDNVNSLAEAKAMMRKQNKVLHIIAQEVFG